MVPARQDIADDALHGATRWLVGFEHDIDSRTRNHFTYCGNGGMPPSVHVGYVGLCVVNPARTGSGMQSEKIWVASEKLKSIKPGGGALVWQGLDI